MGTKRCLDCAHSYRQADYCIGCDIEPHQAETPLAVSVRNFRIKSYPAIDDRDFNMAQCPGFVPWKDPVRVTTTASAGEVVWEDKETGAQLLDVGLSRKLWWLDLERITPEQTSAILERYKAHCRGGK